MRLRRLLNTALTQTEEPLTMGRGMAAGNEPSNSKDPFSAADRARLAATIGVVPGKDDSPTVPRTEASALLVRLADQAGVPLQDLLARIGDKDTIRRTKYPVIEHKNEDGSIVYERPVV